MRRPRVLFSLALVAGLLLPQHPDASPVPGVIAVGPGGATLGYLSKVAVEPQGSELTFVNGDELAHTVTAVDRDPDGKPLFSGNALPGTTSVIAGVDRLKAGSYDFVCSFHPNMAGTLLVQGGSGGVGAAKPRFQTPLKMPEVLTGSRITLTAEQADVPLLPGRPATTMYTFNGSWPGPTIRRPVGAKTTVTVVNKLPSAFGSISLHVHGDHHSSADDGRPDSDLVATGKAKTYTLGLKDGGKAERAAFSFYHDHRMDETGRNNWYGLNGMFITDDPKEKRLGLPTGAYDLPLTVADRSFDDASQLTDPFPTASDATSPTTPFTGPYAPPGDATAGTRTLVNGTFLPYQLTANRRYRVRLLNASNFSSYDFHFSDGRPMVQVGNGAALLSKPVTRTDVLLGPAERADVVVDFSNALGKNVVLESIARTDGSLTGIGSQSTPLMQFRVTKRAPQSAAVPAALVPLPALDIPTAPTMTWVLGLGANTGGTHWTVNGQPYEDGRTDAAITLGSTQRWAIVNASTITHYVHLHEEAWRTVTRNGQPPPAWEAGLQDTWRLDPGDVVEVAARVTDFTGPFLIHCHMLDHEDHGLMATFTVLKPGQQAPAHKHPTLLDLTSRYLCTVPKESRT
ncbi:MAG: Multicopper oxidase [Frankiales bacterium]|nr:Multicopper oxidase [Frankiales bacterium]